ncbi:AbrB family transcriptional regulator (plasmid) [Azospirillum sp. TSH58]|uniref:AbrB/MazE/SpoVT family DNA-binding domain-containing protein n=1 Tax=Azospirillum brasilense TaxID=192 RepID=A0A4D8R9U4_AZOBR|nr:MULTISPECIES: AbrB/MazE/SpoVT family DNA-binding domain-containing protein [Azospirillum]AWJ87999.1 AbrB family transcriptional regulator [Azospirillum sp. TSH58]PWC72488.1 AbrB family transcriptional regulator [Azospirillum sp. TSH58]QCO19557.1 AbrB/MazE/SpoVT family DNA-binding domain-containing protein [Azospirillum brasilense]
MATTLTTKGQVTIPKPIRDRLGLGPGSAVEFEIAEDGRVVLSRADRAVAARSRFERLRGRATAGLSTDQIMALTRGED